MSLSIFPNFQETLVLNFYRDQPQQKFFIGQKEIISAADVLHTLPPVCSSTQQMNCSFGTTILLPIFSTGKPGSCISS